MNRLFAVFIFSAVILLPALSDGITEVRPAVANFDVPSLADLRQDGWQLIQERDGIRIYYRLSNDHAVPEYSAWTVMEVPAELVYKEISDYDRFAEFIPYVQESKVLRSAGETRWVYQRLSLPLPIADRTYVIRIAHEIKKDVSRFYRIHWALDEGVEFSGSHNKGVKPRVFNGYWFLWPIDNGLRTQAVYGIQMDPGGSVPGWLAKWGNQRLLQRLIKAVQEHVREIAKHQP